MEVVAATKMRRSQEVALNIRPFAISAFGILERLIGVQSLENLGLWTESPATGGKTVCVITSDKGLAGSLNSSVLRKAEELIRQHQREGVVNVITIGKKAKEYFDRRGYNIIKEWYGKGDLGAFDETEEIADFIEKKFLTGNISEFIVVYTNFRSTLLQEVVAHTVLPLKRASINNLLTNIAPEHGRYSQQTAIPQTNQDNTMIFEPSKDAVLKTLLPYFFRLIMYHVILEANASEHSARMVAMKKASDNAGEIIEDLTLLYNKSRQAAITQELIEITAGTQ